MWKLIEFNFILLIRFQFICKLWERQRDGIKKAQNSKEHYFCLEKFAAQLRNLMELKLILQHNAENFSMTNGHVRHFTEKLKKINLT